MASGASAGQGSQTSLLELALLFLRLGATSFGGPAAHIALLQEEVVTRRRWIREERFLDLLGAANLIPGPTSTELAIHVGYERRRWAGLVVAGLSFIAPAMAVTAACGWAYVSYGALPQAGWLLWGVKPVILAVVVQAIWGLAPKAGKTWLLRGLGLGALIGAALGVDELLVLALSGAIALAAGGHARASLAMLPLGTVPAVVPPVTLSSLFWVFCKIGSVLFGSGYVLLAFLKSELVERLGWLTDSQLFDAIAVGQVTPGPVFTTATFIGYVLSGPAGALAATAGIFLPAFVFVALSGPLVPRLRGSKAASAFLDGVNVASLALMAVVTAQLARAALVDASTVVLGLLSAVLLVRFKLNSTWLVLGGAGAGLALHALG